MSDNLLPSTEVQTNLINANLNSNLFNILMLGIYTSVYIGTMYIYLARKPSHSAYVLTSITILYVTNIAQTGVIWFLVRSLVGLAGQSKENFYIFSFFSSNWAILTNDVFYFILSTVADGLLIWRCYNVWDGSFRAIIVSFILLVAEAVLYLSVIICAGVTHLHPPSETAKIMDDLLGAAFFTSLGSTMVTTGLIVYRIVSVSRTLEFSQKKNRGRFTEILDLIVQSAALYGLALLVSAILSVTPLHFDKVANEQALAIAQYFVNVTFPVIAGFAPTIMVARVALASSTAPRQSEMAHISDLEFNGAVNTTNRSAYNTNIEAHSVSDHDVFSQREQKEVDKTQ